MLDRGIGGNNHCHKNKAESTSLLKINLIKPLKRMETILTMSYISEKIHKKIIFPFIFETLFSKPAQSNQHGFRGEKCTKDTAQRQVAAAAVATQAYKLPSLQLIIMRQSRGYQNGPCQLIWKNLSYFQCQIGSLMSLCHWV